MTGPRSVAAVVAALAWLALAPGAPAAAQDRDDGEPGGPRIILQESASRSLPNDRVQAFLRAEAEGLNPTEVQAEVTQLMMAALEAARAVAEVDAATEGYSVYYRRDDRRWVGQQRLRLESDEPDAVLPLIGELQGLGLLMDGLGSYLSQAGAEAAADELIVEALGRLQDRLRLLADALEHGSFRLEELRIGGVGEPPPMPYRTMALERAAPAMDMAPPAFEAGETRVEVRIDATAVLLP